MPLAEQIPPSSLPINVAREESSGIRIEWSSGEHVFIPSRALREHCPCASCREKRGDSSHQQPLSPGKRKLQVLQATVEEELGLKQVWPVGNYAIGMRWADKHDSGIYSYQYLRELSSRLGEPVT